MQQQTLAKPAAYAGVGLHSGKEVEITLHPAPVDTGIVFVRTDLEERTEIPAVAANVTSTLRATTLSMRDVRIFTVEHLMSALHGFGIDNCRIEINAEEPPVADGSSIVFLDLLKNAGRVQQDKERREIRIDKVYRIDDGERFVMAVPYDGLRVSFTSLNERKLIGVQYHDFILTEDVYRKDIAPARTIAYEKEVDALRAAGLGLGGTLENVIVYNDEGWLNTLRFEDELVRHKILDLLGDVRLAGAVKGHFIAVKSGHELNTRLAKAIYADWLR
ncbi:UDP-3-O-acyl-N-acetylglucosamine deacetylase [Selenomonas sp. TAMA-11512]|uniref:UDP-3-O-acyl-N-acetylglucosamine deacetylase n=1 Tax=Selenomonas sp. TAMA-11512 TaxID=3095337 RepID=UPI0030930898|nr:UDP-3-O-acyl-N-acetylglucosamine deacetylase [Selenomonas sp. TAMA-11512]